MDKDNDSKEAMKEELRQTLANIQREKANEMPRGGLIPDPTRQLAKKVYELEKRIVELETIIGKLDSEMMMFRPLG